MFLGTNREDCSGRTGCSWGQIERYFVTYVPGAYWTWGQIEKTAQDVLMFLGTNREDCSGRLDVLGDK